MSEQTHGFYYVLSDKSRAMAAVHCTPTEFNVLKRGQQDPQLPHVPDDTVFVSGSDRAKTRASSLRQVHEACA